MKRLIIIGTSHEEKDLTTIDDLCIEITRINPDVIFEEVPVDMFTDIYEHHLYHDSIEVQAVRKYISKKNDVDHFPIDIGKLQQLSGILSCDEIETEVDKYIKEQNNKCLAKRLTEKLETMDSMGYRKMNSHFHRCVERLKQKTTKKYLLRNNKELYFKNRMEDQFHFEVRESFMINEIAKNIERYSRPLLLIGYSHIPTIAQKIKIGIKGVKVKIY